MIIGAPTFLEGPIDPEKYSKIQDTLPKYVREISENTAKEKAADILDELVPYCVDLGASQEKHFILNNVDVHIDESSAPVLILNRSAFIAYIEELPDKSKENSSIQLLDIEDLRSSANVPTESEDAAADIIINNFSKILVDKAYAINERLAEISNNPSKVVVCRYGGDEFGILFENFEDPEIKKRALEYITNPDDGLTSIDGYFMRNGQLEKRKIHLKQGIPEINAPKDENKKKYFLESMHKGILLNDSEIESSLIFPESNVIKNTLPTIPEQPTLSDSTERWGKLLNKHYEFDKVFQMIDSNYKNINDGLPELIELERFIYHIAYDRLLGEYVSDLKAFSKHFIEQPYKNVHIVDLKGIKEINDEYSIASGDKAIFAVWQKIKESCGDEELPKMEFFKRGGLFVICDNFETTDVTERPIQNLTNVAVTINGVVHTFSLATTSWTNANEQNLENEEKVAKMLGNAINKSEQEWFRDSIVLANASHPEYFEKSAIPSKDQIRQGYIDISSPEIFNRMFLYGKREEERTSKAISAINEILEDIKDPEKAKGIIEKSNLSLGELQNNLENIRLKIKAPKSQA